MAADAEIELPDTICGDLIPSAGISPGVDRECLVGIAGNSRIAQGTSRVVHDPAEAPATLTREDILIVPFTKTG